MPTKYGLSWPLYICFLALNACYRARKWLRFVWVCLRIPSGIYCTSCPYWRPRIAPIEIGDREIAYCIYLDKTDLDIAKEREFDMWTEEKTKEKCLGKDLPLSFSSLLWDGCKECNVKTWEWREWLNACYRIKEWLNGKK